MEQKAKLYMAAIVAVASLLALWSIQDTSTDSTGLAMQTGSERNNYIAPICYDSDGNSANSYYVKGTLRYTYGSLSPIRGDYAIVMDFCSGNAINEAFCFVDNNKVTQFGWTGITCPNGCSDGACIRSMIR